MYDELSSTTPFGPTDLAGPVQFVVGVLPGTGHRYAVYFNSAGIVCLRDGEPFDAAGVMEGSPSASGRHATRRLPHNQLELAVEFDCSDPSLNGSCTGIYRPAPSFWHANIPPAPIEAHCVNASGDSCDSASPVEVDCSTPGAFQSLRARRQQRLLQRSAGNRRCDRHHVDHDDPTRRGGEQLNQTRRLLADREGREPDLHSGTEHLHSHRGRARGRRLRGAGLELHLHQRHRGPPSVPASHRTGFGDDQRQRRPSRLHLPFGCGLCDVYADLHDHAVNPTTGSATSWRTAFRRDGFRPTPSRTCQPTTPFPRPSSQGLPACSVQLCPPWCGWHRPCRIPCGLGPISASAFRELERSRSPSMTSWGGKLSRCSEGGSTPARR